MATQRNGGSGRSSRTTEREHGVAVVETTDWGVFTTSERGVRTFVDWVHATDATEVDLGLVSGRRPTDRAVGLRRYGAGRMALVLGGTLDATRRARLAGLAFRLGVPLLQETNALTGRARTWFLRVEDDAATVSLALHGLLREVLGYPDLSVVGVGRVRMASPASVDEALADVDDEDPASEGRASTLPSWLN